MDIVPTYALYGESTEMPVDLRVHCESIPARSGLFNWEIAPHRHASFFQILYMSEGTAELRLQAGNYALEPKALLTMPPRAIHGFRFSPNVEGYVVTVRIERIEQMLAGAPGIRAFFDVPRVLDLVGQNAAALRVARHIETIAEECAASREGRGALVEANLVILLIEMARVIETSGARSKNADRHARHFRALVDRYFRGERAVAFYAERLGVSETHLNRIARAVFDQSALGLINQRLLREAARDLTFTSLPVKDIARSLGFDDPAYFSRFFTKQMGLSPTGFRAEEARKSGDRSVQRTT